MPQRMSAKYPELVFLPEHSHLHLADTNRSRPRKQLLGAQVVEFRKALMEIYLIPCAIEIRKCGLGFRVALLCKAEVDVAVRSQSHLGIQPCDRPPFDQQWLRS